MRMGKIIAFEGIDNCGKDTLMHKLRIKLSKTYKITTIPSVTTTEVGKLVRIYSRLGTPNKDQLVMLYMADFYNKLELIKDAQFENDLIFCSRWFSSTMAYCGDTTKQCSIMNLLKDTLRPDITLYIKISVEESLKRQKSAFKVTDIYSNKKVLEEAALRYEDIFKDEFFNAVTLDGEKNTPNMLREEATDALLNKNILAI